MGGLPKTVRPPKIFKKSLGALPGVVSWMDNGLAIRRESCLLGMHWGRIGIPEQIVTKENPESRGICH